jgi:N-acetylglucosamine-6-phosphate deacetylase
MTSSHPVLAIDVDAILTPFERFAPGRIIIRDGRIEAAGLAYDVRVPAGAQHLNETGSVLAPGFIDSHIHGSAGVDVMDATSDALDTISRHLASHGTTAFLPTTVSSPLDVFGKIIEQLGVLLDRTYSGAQPLGLHLEGPFISPVKCGAHRTDCIQKPDVRLLDEWIRLSGSRIRLLTLAPELPDVVSLLASARRAGVCLAMGHSTASYEESAAAVENGIVYAVHVFNAMRELNHREPGIVGAVLSDDRVFAEVIADGVHVHPRMVQILSRAKPRERVLLITDAISAAGMADGQYRLGRDSVQVSGGVCRDLNGRLAGSTLSQDVALQNFVNWTGAELQDCLFALTSNPAEVLQLVGRGRIEAGCWADLVLLNKNLQVVKTFVAGKLVFERQN